MLQWFAKFCLFLLGWDSLSKETLQNVQSIQKGIGIFPHTSIWDGIIFGLYYLAYPKELGHIYTLVARRFFKGPLGWLLIKSHCIPIENHKIPGDTGYGQCGTLEKKFQSLDKFFLILSPKGSSGVRPWKKGFLVLSQLLKVPIYIVGLNYWQKKVEIGKQKLYFTAQLKPTDEFPTISWNTDKNNKIKDEPIFFDDLEVFKRCILMQWQRFPVLYPNYEPEIPKTMFVSFSNKCSLSE